MYVTTSEKVINKLNMYIPIYDQRNSIGRRIRRPRIIIRNLDRSIIMQVC